MLRCNRRIETAIFYSTTSKNKIMSVYVNTGEFGPNKVWIDFRWSEPI